MLENGFAEGAGLANELAGTDDPNESVFSVSVDAAVVKEFPKFG
jgi:hypothetical protein